MERSLKQFIAVAETGSITAAAAQLNVSQPTITVNIRNLEQKHGVDLFERTPRGMVLTDFGSMLYESARVIERVETQASQNIRSHRMKLSQAIRIGCGHAWWPLFVHGVIEDALERNPRTSLHVESGSNLQCMWKMLSGDISLSVGHEIPNLDPAIRARFVPLFKSIDALFVAQDHPLVGRLCTPADLTDFPGIVSVPLDIHYRKVLTSEQPGNASGAEADLAGPHYSSNALLTCVDMAITSRGFTTFPMDMAERLSFLGLVPLRMRESGPAKQIGLYYLPDNPEQSKLMKLVERISAAARAYEAARPLEHRPGMAHAGA